MEGDPLKSKYVKHYYQKHVKQQEGVDKEEKTMKHHYSENQRGLQRAFIQTKKREQQKPESQNKERNHSERRLLRESQPHNGSRGGVGALLPDSIVLHASPAIPS